METREARDQALDALIVQARNRVYCQLAPWLLGKRKQAEEQQLRLFTLLLTQTMNVSCPPSLMNQFLL